MACVVSSSVVVCRRLSSLVVVVASQICCHWGKLLQVTLHGRVTCQFAPLFHCDLHDQDMSRKKRDAFRCTGAAFCEIRRLLRISIGISVWRVVFLGCWMWPCHWDLRFRVASKLGFRDKSQLKWRFWWMGVCSERVEIIPNVWCGANFVEAHMR